jgi:multicomponent Na+:H+ antiporter subunit B
MIKRLTAFVLLAFIALLLYGLVTAWHPIQSLTLLAREYASRGAAELGAANLVTAIVVTYRGLDTLGEVAVLFLAATGVGLLLGRREPASEKSGRNGRIEKRPSSEILKAGADFLVPVIIMFGAYIFLNGHLSPGGGFQGGAVVASAILLLFLAYPDYRMRHGVLLAVESLSGFAYVAIALLALLLTGSFLDTRLLPPGEFGTIVSAGAIPLIYLLIGLKVGTELAGILENLRSDGDDGEVAA